MRIEVDREKYVASHGKNPRGGDMSGSWLFQLTAFDGSGSSLDLGVLEFRGSYSVALRDAKYAARDAGKSCGRIYLVRIVVLP